MSPVWEPLQRFDLGRFNPGHINFEILVGCHPHPKLRLLTSWNGATKGREEGANIGSIGYY
jgi:hypothetical protein